MRVPCAPGRGCLPGLPSGATLETGLTQAEAEVRLARDGANEIREAPRHPLLRLLGKFWGGSAWMLELIAALSFALHKSIDGWIALALLGVNAVLSFFQEQRASSAVDALRRRLQVSARVLRDGGWSSRPARELVVGDVVRVRAGDFVPADGVLLEGEIGVDQSALTGESLEAPRRPGEALYSGSIVRRGEATASITATGARTYYGRTTHLIESARPRLHLEEVTARLVKWLFAVVGTLVGGALVLSLSRGERLLELLPLVLVLLMSAVPVALPVMFTVSTAVGSMELGRHGLLVTHLAAVEDAATMDILCADKTGTLTANRLALAGVVVQPGFSEEDVLRTAALASNAANRDPIDLAFLGVAAGRGLLDQGVTTRSFTPFSPATRRTEAVVERGGRSLHVVKGALRTVAGLTGLPHTEVEALEARSEVAAKRGARVLAVARGEAGGALQLVGLALLHDPPRPDSGRLIAQLRSLGIRVKMLTGDALPVAREIARELGLGDIARASELRTAVEREPARATELVTRTDGVAEVFPEDKVRVVESLQAAGHVVGMTGDGVNDAPALRQAEVGIAVSGATDVARGAASLVLTDEGLGSIVHLVEVGRAIYQRVLTWIVNKVSRTILKAGFVVVAYFATGKFVISALGMVLLVFLTDFVKISLSTDNVRASSSPETWRIAPLVKVSVVLGVVMLLEALALFALGGRLFALEGDRVHTFSFVTLVAFALCSILSLRERRAFWSSPPSWILATALAAEALAATAIGLWGLADLAPLPLGQLAFIFAGAGLFGLGLNDALKTVLVRRLWTIPRDRLRV